MEELVEAVRLSVLSRIRISVGAVVVHRLMSSYS
jgi:hypothetical protein